MVILKRLLIGAALLTLTASLQAADSSFSATAHERHKEMDEYYSGHRGMKKPSIWHQPHMTGDWGGKRTWLIEEGVTITASYVMDVLGNIVGGKAKGMAFAGSFGSDINLKFEQWTPCLLYTSPSPRD